MKKKIEPSRCVCGREPYVHHVSPTFHVCCGFRSGMVCWFGAARKSAHGAILAWNRVMDAARQAKEKR